MKRSSSCRGRLERFIRNRGFGERYSKTDRRAIITHFRCLPHIILLIRIHELICFSLHKHTSSGWNQFLFRLSIFRHILIHWCLYNRPNAFQLSYRNFPSRIWRMTKNLLNCEWTTTTTMTERRKSVGSMYSVIGTRSWSS